MYLVSRPTDDFQYNIGKHRLATHNELKEDTDES